MKKILYFLFISFCFFNITSVSASTLIPSTKVCTIFSESAEYSSTSYDIATYSERCGYDASMVSWGICHNVQCSYDTWYLSRINPIVRNMEFYNGSTATFTINIKYIGIMNSDISTYSLGRYDSANSQFLGVFSGYKGSTWSSSYVELLNSNMTWTHSSNNELNIILKITLYFKSDVTGVSFDFNGNSGYRSLGYVSHMSDITHKVTSIQYDSDNSSALISGQQDINNSINNNGDKIDELNSSINDSSSPNNLNSLSNTAGWLPAGPVDSILNLPFTWLNSLLTSLDSSCSPLNLSLPYVDSTLTLPCLSSIFSQIDGLSTFWNWVGNIASVIILYQYLLNLYSWVDKTLTMRLEFDEAMGIDTHNWGRL